MRSWVATDRIEQFAILGEYSHSNATRARERLLAGIKDDSEENDLFSTGRYIDLL